MEKKILLVDPPFQKFMGFSKGGIPLGLLYLAGELKRSNHKVRVLDSDYNPNGTPYPFIAKIEHYHQYLDSLNNGQHPIWEEIASHIKKEKPDVVGISIISPKLKSGLRVARIAKDLGVKKVIIGGPHATICPEEALRNGYIDSVVRGEGEEVFERAINESGIITSDRIKDLNSLAWPARESLIGVENYQRKDLGFVMTSRGCPNKCNFCCSNILWGNRVRMRDIGDVIDEIGYIHEQHGNGKDEMNEFYLVDDTFTMNKRRVHQFCDGIRDRNYKWSCLTRVDRLNEGMLENMMSSGCSMIKVGIESGSQKVLNLMNKGISVEQIEHAAELLNRYRMPWLAYVMAGVPGETSKDADETMKLIDRTKPSYVSASIYAPYPGTGFSNHEGDIDFAREVASHNSMEILAGDVPREKIIEFMRFVDEYNANSRAAHEIYKC